MLANDAGSRRSPGTMAFGGSGGGGGEVGGLGGAALQAIAKSADSTASRHESERDRRDKKARLQEARISGRGPKHQPDRHSWGGIAGFQSSTSNNLAS